MLLEELPHAIVRRDAGRRGAEEMRARLAAGPGVTAALDDVKNDLRPTLGGRVRPASHAHRIPGGDRKRGDVGLLGTLVGPHPIPDRVGDGAEMDARETLLTGPAGEGRELI